MVTNDIRYDVLEHWSVLENAGRRNLAEQLRAAYHRLYVELITELHGRGVEIGVLIFPSKFDLLAGRAPEEEFFIELADGMNVPYLSLMPVSGC